MTQQQDIRNYIYYLAENTANTSISASFQEIEDFMAAACGNTDLDLDFELSLKSPAYIDFSEIDPLNTPEALKLKCIYNKLTNSPEFKRLFEGTFGGDQQKLNIKFKMQANLVDGDGDIVRGRCNPNPLDGSNYQEIILNSDQLAGPEAASNIYIAKTIIHELIHAYLNVKYVNINNGPTLTFLSDLELEELLEQVFNTNDPLQLGINQHNFMSQHMIPQFQTILSEIVNVLLSSQNIAYLNNQQITDLNGVFIENFNFMNFYKYLAYEGLHNTQSYMNNINNNLLELSKHEKYNQFGRDTSTDCQ